MDDSFLPYGKQTITDADLAAVREALLAPLLTTGPKVGEFERAFAARVGAAEAVACANGTAALHLASLALGLGPGDTVIAPTLSFVASANGPHYTGARIVFCDCDPATGLITPELFAQAIERAGGPVRAAVIVHLNGELADMAAIAEIAARHGIAVVEDACHAIGSRGAAGGDGMAEAGDCRFSAMACFSMHPVKTMTMGEGGVVTTNDKDLAERLRLLRNHGLSREPENFTRSELAFDAGGAVNPWYYEMAEPGFNYRATDIACALGLSQLGQLGGFIERRKTLKQAYDRLFAGFDGPVRPVPTPQWSDPCRHLYPVLVDFRAAGTSRATLMARLAERGIGTQVHYIPIHWLPYYLAKNPDLRLPGAESYYAQALSLPLFPLMGDGDPERVVAALHDALG